MLAGLPVASGKDRLLTSLKSVLEDVDESALKRVDESALEGADESDPEVKE